jgi:hypothetical protein
MATIPARTASGRRCQTGCYFSHLRRDRFGYNQPPQSLGQVGGPSVELLGLHRLVRVTAGQDPDSKSGKNSGAER